jgi:hypothetical protein
MSRASDEAAASKRRASDNAAAKKRRSDRIAIGLCPHCGKPAEAGKKNCSRHAAAFRNYSNRKYAIKCGRPVENVADARIKHEPGAIFSPEYHAYTSAKGRCTFSGNKHWKHYGGRGIKFLFTSFEQFFAELGARPTEKHSVDRKDNNGNYEPGNVRWATQSEQTKNQRRCMAIQSFTDEEMISELKRRNLVR